MTWLSEEKPLAILAWQQTWRIVDRARRRPWVTLSLSLVLAGLLLGFQVRRPKAFHAQVGLLITEGIWAADGSPRPRGELRGMIEDAILVTARLEKLVEKHDLVDKLGAPSKTLAVAAVRNRTDIDVWQDYLGSYRESPDTPRSARVTIGFWGPDPATALTVARALGEIVAEAQTARDSGAVAANIEGLRAIAQGAAARAADRHEQLERETADAQRRPEAKWDPALLPSARAVKAADAEARSAAAALFDAQLQNRKLHNAGRLVQIVDPGVPMWQTLPLRQRLIRQAALSCVVALLASIVLVGGLDPTVRDGQDLRRTGLELLGNVPAWHARPPRPEV